MTDESPQARAEALLPQLTLEEKAGLLFHAMIMLTPDGEWVTGDHAPAADPARMVTELKMSHFNLMGSPGARVMADRLNELQALAADTRLGVPITFSTDPRHAFSENLGTAWLSGAFSQWPESLGLAAIADEDLVERFADTVRREYLAVGLRVALHPQIDLATEPRWSRISGTFGEDADLTGRLAAAYIRGLRGTGDGHDGLGPESVAAMVKHFPGGGPQQDGEDPHFPYGREQVYPGGRFDYHLAPFLKAFEAGVTQVMPYYGMPIGTEYEEVAFGFNKSVIEGLLRERLGFDGIVCTDWGLVTDAAIMGEKHPARAWGVEHLSELERVELALNAGVDQFGGEHRPELVVELVRSGRIAEERIDVSVRRLLIEKFRLGLFDERRYADPDRAEEIVGSSEFRAAGAAAQRQAITLLSNASRTLPVSGRPRLYVDGLDDAAIAVVAAHADVAATPAEADLALLRLGTPFDPRPGMFESFFHAGRLDFEPSQLAEILEVCDTVPTVVAIHLERPAVIPEIAERAAAVVADFGASTEALLDVLFGKAAPGGRLPFQLPRSMDAVRNGKPDVPQEDPNPVFGFGHGLSY